MGVMDGLDAINLELSRLTVIAERAQKVAEYAVLRDLIDRPSFDFDVVIAQALHTLSRDLWGTP